MIIRGAVVNRMATIGDVARRAGVSTTLVSRYLNGVKGVSPASKEKIENAIRELNYVPDESARMLVRRRGGAGAAPVQNLPQPSAKDTLPTAVALLCEDVDFQLISALYLGAKHAIWANGEHRDTRIILFCIPADEHRAEDEEATLSYIMQTCRGICAVGISQAMNEKLHALAEPLPVITVMPRDDAKLLYRTAPDFREVCTALEEDNGSRILRLCERISGGTTGVLAESVSVGYTLTVSDEPYPEHSPVGRRLQSHLL